MPLLECRDIHGHLTVLGSEPPLLTIHDALFVPIAGNHGPWGLFDHGRKLILQSASFRGPSPFTDGPALETSLAYEQVEARQLDEDLVYAGFIHGHYGHFLLSSLCRFWCIDRWLKPDTRIVFHSNETIEALFRRPFFAAICGQLELTPDRFLHLQDPCILRRVVIPGPAFEETGFAHRAFTTFTNALGASLVSGRGLKRTGVPAYLSKARLASGVGHLVNEEELSDTLQRHGFDIIHPETMVFEDQVALFHERDCIAALTGSALHTGLLAPGNRVFGLGYGDTLLSSYPLIDRINNTAATYLYPEGDIDLLPRTDEFHLNYRLRDPRRTGDELTRAVEFSMAARRTRSSSSAGIAVCATNLALDAKTQQSSFGPKAAAIQPEGRIASCISTGTSGILTGRFQFHTDHEQDPWWQVDLGQTCLVEEIRLHNRTDNSGERCSRFIMMSSLDGMEWSVLHRQDEAYSFGGGMQADAFVWKAGVPGVASHVRIILLGREFFHLDQVEVFGTRPESGRVSTEMRSAVASL